MLSKTERDAIKLLEKAKYGYRFLPEWMKFRGPLVADQPDQDRVRQRVATSNRCRRLSDPARGETVYLVVVDELAYLPNSDEAWSSIEPIADVGGRVICSATANGEGNLFHKLWVGARTSTNRFKSMFHPVVGERPRRGVVRRQEGRPARVAAGPGVPATTPTTRSCSRVARCSTSTCCAAATADPPLRGLPRQRPTVAVRVDDRRWTADGSGSARARRCATPSGPTSPRVWSTATSPWPTSSTPETDGSSPTGTAASTPTCSAPTSWSPSGAGTTTR